MDCLLCRIVARTEEASIVYEDDRVVAICDLYPVNPGHLLVITKAHAVGLGDLNATDGCQMFAVAQRLAAALRKTDLRCEGINLFLADGEAAFQEVFTCTCTSYRATSGTNSHWTPASRPLHRPARSLTPSRPKSVNVSDQQQFGLRPNPAPLRDRGSASLVVISLRPAVVDYRSGSGNRGSDAKASGTCCRTTRAPV
jgi:hypothetical protein